MGSIAASEWIVNIYSQGDCIYCFPAWRSHSCYLMFPVLVDTITIAAIEGLLIKLALESDRKLFWNK
ncbi:hypothetical protein [Anabaena sp. CA = ATCC 33047]|uniref:hypothetical protein n=1 Tax=Anabaena sp. (strain CA / ATCC 33047) TaxID=52271 RepID=UPI0012EE2E9E|nr:hypothetical protein [Anabaena sp. CA = ATCC 33047]